MRYKALLRHFEENGPPLYVMKAQELGVKLKSPKGASMSQDELIEMLRSAGGLETDSCPLM